MRKQPQRRKAQSSGIRRGSLPGTPPAPVLAARDPRRAPSLRRILRSLLATGRLLRYVEAVPETKEESALDKLWQEYARSFRDFDDLTLARWCSQTLGQLHGRAWRLSHPLVGAYRLGSQLAHDRQVWLKRLVNIPAGYVEAPCCRAPLLPLFTRDVAASGLICQHCNETAVPFDQLAKSLQARYRAWADTYAPVHDVAHWDDKQRRVSRDYESAFENAAQRAEELLAEAAHDLVPLLLESFPAVVWEDQDECLEVRPEDIVL